MRLVLIALALAACRAPARPRENAATRSSAASATAIGASAAAQGPSAMTREHLDELALLATGWPMAASALDAHLAALKAGTEHIEGIIDQLIAQPEAGQLVAPLLFTEAIRPSKRLFAVGASPFLAATTAPGEPTVYHLREPCRAAQAEDVRPWWDLASTVKVCRDSHQPGHLIEPRTGQYCGGEMTAPALSRYCGCGPNLILCARDAAQVDGFRRSALAELTDTVAWVVNHDLPLERIFTMNESVRDRNIEFRYRRWRLVNGEAAVLPSLRSLARWPQGPSLAPRDERYAGQHAGVLTSIQLLRQHNGQRERAQFYSQALWCLPNVSAKVQTEQVLALGTANLREGEGWERLSRMPVCSSCHARIDNLMQFFFGFSWLVKTPDYSVADEKHGRGRVYIMGPDDLRGEIPLAPRAFAELAVRQPEFTRCMSQRVLDHVLADGATPEDRHAVEVAFATQGTWRAMLKAALLRHAARLGIAAAPAAPRASPLAQAQRPITAGVAIHPSSATSVDLSPVLRERLAAHCLRCHDGSEPEAPDLSGTQLPFGLLVSLLEQVATARMPKAPRGMSALDRAALTDELVAALYPVGTARTEAQQQARGDRRALPAHRAGPILHVLDGRTGRSVPPLGVVESSDDINEDLWQYTPGLATAVGLEALGRCRQRKDLELEACLTRALVPETLVSTQPLR